VLLVAIRGAVITFLNSVKDGTDASFPDLLSNQPDQTPSERLQNQMTNLFSGAFLSLLLVVCASRGVVTDITCDEVKQAVQDVTGPNGELRLPGEAT
jgi:hypothetical protein